MKGFTLIELMTVVAVIAILALLAVPSMQDRLLREQIVEAARLADIAKAPIAASWAKDHALPLDNAAAGLPVAEKIVSNHIRSLTVEGGAIHGPIWQCSRCCRSSRASAGPRLPWR